MAGKRAGMVEGTRSNLWGAMRTAIETIRPQYAVIENVRGLLSATAQSDSDLEQRPGFMGDRPNITLRAIGRVLGDLADIGYDAQWHGLRASDIGAPHGRYRIFILATNTSSARPQRGQWRLPKRVRARPELDNRRNQTTADTSRRTRRIVEVEHKRIQRLRADALQTPTNTGGPTIGEYTGGPSAEEARTRSSHRSGDPHREQPITNWGPYQPAIRGWERSLGRTAPVPTELSAKGKPQLSTAFVEWMMGLNEGHVTSIDGISRANQLKMLGNGVVPQQALAALQHMTRVTSD